MQDTYSVYVRADDAGRVTDIGSSAFLDDATGWVLIDSGVGDRYHHAQGNYLPGPLTDTVGRYRYKLQDGAVTQRTEAEIAADETGQTASPPTTGELLERLQAMQSEYDAALVELAALIG